MKIINGLLLHNIYLFIYKSPSLLSLFTPSLPHHPSAFFVVSSIMSTDNVEIQRIVSFVKKHLILNPKSVQYVLHKHIRVDSRVRLTFRHF